MQDELDGPAVTGSVRAVPGADDIARKARDAFEAEYGDRPPAAVMVIMPALNEAATVASVVRAVPGIVWGLTTECVVIDDGSFDATSAEARRAGAMVCRLPVNLGQGRAFRVGYDLAVRRGTRIVATLDADGQFDPGELARVVGPVASGDADLVNGSRRLGRSETTDGVRRAGVAVFGAVISVLTRNRITDPANGFRAFRVDVARTVPLRQVQYQTAELLLGAVSYGFRVSEVGVTVRRRASGRSKKGHNAFYGYRFAKVVATTWWSPELVRARRER